MCIILIYTTTIKNQVTKWFTCAYFYQHAWHVKCDYAATGCCFFGLVGLTGDSSTAWGMIGDVGTEGRSNEGSVWGFCVFSVFTGFCSVFSGCVSPISSASSLEFLVVPHVELSRDHLVDLVLHRDGLVRFVKQIGNIVETHLLVELVQRRRAGLQRSQNLHVRVLPLNVLDHLQHRHELRVDLVGLGIFEPPELQDQQGTVLLLLADELLRLLK